METIDIHLGSMVQEELQRQEKSVHWLAKAIKMERSGIYKLFRRKNISVQLLLKISIVLHHNFFDDISKALNDKKLEENTGETAGVENGLQ